jgi:hypothetical protein
VIEYGFHRKVLFCFDVVKMAAIRNEGNGIKAEIGRVKRRGGVLKVSFGKM